MGLTAWVTVALGFALRLRLVLAYPAVYGGDSVARLAHSDLLVLGYQLPLPQLLVFVTRAVAPDPLWTRLVFCSLGSLVPIALALALAPACGRTAAGVAALLLAVNPLFLYYSLVPYQEGPMLLLLLAAAAALQHGRDLSAGVLIGLACLCRYEAWIAAALCIAFGPGRLPRRVVLFGWAPLLWIACWRGLSPAGTYVLDLEPQTSRLARVAFLGGKLREYSGTASLLLAGAGAAVAVARPRRPLGWGALYLAIFSFVIVAAGHEFPPGSGRVSERLIHVPAAAVCALAGLAIGWLADAALARPARIAAALLAVAGITYVGARWLSRGERLVAEANAEPSLIVSFQLARFAGTRLPSGGHLAVAAPAVPPEAVEAYVRKVERSGGDALRARSIAQQLAHRSVDADRIAAQLPRPPGTVIDAGSGVAELVAVYDDAPDGERWRRGPALARFTNGARSAAVYSTGPASDP